MAPAFSIQSPQKPFVLLRQWPIQIATRVVSCCTSKQHVQIWQRQLVKKEAVQGGWRRDNVNLKGSFRNYCFPYVKWDSYSQIDLGSESVNQCCVRKEVVVWASLAVKITHHFGWVFPTVRTSLPALGEGGLRPHTLWNWFTALNEPTCYFVIPSLHLFWTKIDLIEITTKTKTDVQYYVWTYPTVDGMRKKSEKN